jgi:energy-coupling factor transport system permease protein
MNPKIKLLLLIIISTFAIIIRDLFYISLFSIAIIVSIFLLKIYSKLLEWVKPISIICFFIVVLNTFTYIPFKFSLEGLIFGVAISLRLFVVLSLVLAFVSTTSMKELSESFNFLPSELALILMLAFRMLPLVKDETLKIINAQKSRGLNFKSLNFFKTYLPILIPLFSKTLEKSNHLALAMESRGFEENKLK